jgi:hypothetical protein
VEELKMENNGVKTLVGSAETEVGKNKAIEIAREVDAKVQDNKYKNIVSAEMESLARKIQNGESEILAIAKSAAKADAKAQVAFESTKEMTAVLARHVVSIYDALQKEGIVDDEKQSFIDNFMNGYIKAKGRRKMPIDGLLIGMALTASQDYFLSTDVRPSTDSNSSTYLKHLFSNSGVRELTIPEKVLVKGGSDVINFYVSAVSGITIVNASGQQTHNFFDSELMPITSNLAMDGLAVSITTQADGVKVAALKVTAGFTCIVHTVVKYRISAGLSIQAVVNAIGTYIATGINPFLGVLASLGGPKLWDLVQSREEIDPLVISGT